MWLWRDKLLEFLREDVGFADLTTELVIPEGTVARCRIIAKQDGVVSGVEEAAELFRMAGVGVVEALESGSKVKKGDAVLEVEGDARAVFACERVALNILMRMSGIATATAEMVTRAREVNPNVVVAGTRKTTPGLRWMEKKAITHGGGDPHRYRLDDCILIKRPHVVVAGGVGEAVRRVREALSFTKKVEVEVSTPEEAVEAAKAGADIVMLDNMSPDGVKRTLELLEKEGLRRRVLVEASGGITPENVAEYAATGVDIVSSGYLTHSARALDMGLKVVWFRKPPRPHRP